MKELEEQLKTLRLELDTADHLPFSNELWPTCAQTSVKVRFLASCGILHLNFPSVIAKYILTLENLNSNDNGCLLLNLQDLFASKSWPEGPIHAQKLIALNLAMCKILQPDVHLINTSFEHDNVIGYRARIERLQKMHTDNFFLYRQLVEIKDARNNNRPLPLLYPEPCAILTAPNAEDLDPKPHQELFEYLLLYAASRGLRKTESGIYAEHISNLPEHTKTNWFKLVHDSFSKWIHHAVGDRMTNPIQWHQLTLRDNTIKACENYLSNCIEPRLPFLKKNRTLFSYRNGIFNTVTGKLYLFKQRPNFPHVSELPANESSANYFDFELDEEIFDEKFDLDQIKTPAWQHVFEDQKWTKKEIHWFEAILGRLTHAPGTLDDWQGAPFITGVSGCGKSSILRVFMKIYEPIDCGELNDDCEPNFTDQHLRNKFLVVALDITRDLRLSTARFNSWVTGEPLTINIKHKEAISKTWDASLISASNEYPGFKTKAGSGGRRNLIWAMRYAIKKTNTRLKAQMQEQLPLFLVKSALRYRNKVRKYGNQGIWEYKPNGKPILPKMVHDNAKVYMSQNSFPDAFLDSEFVELGAGLHCSEEAFTAKYNYFVGQNAKKGSKRYIEDCTTLNFAYALQHRGCEWLTDSKKIIGLALKEPKMSASKPEASKPTSTQVF
jgi:hypothetical protein